MYDTMHDLSLGFAGTGKPWFVATAWQPGIVDSQSRLPTCGRDRQSTFLETCHVHIAFPQSPQSLAKEAVLDDVTIGEITDPQDVHALLPGNHTYVTLNGKRDSVDVTEIMVLEIGRLPWTFWAGPI